MKRHTIAVAISTVTLAFAASGGTALACGGPTMMPSPHIVKIHTTHHAKSHSKSH